MSIYSPPGSTRLAHAIPQIYQSDPSVQVAAPPRSSTPERVRERQVKSVAPPYAHHPHDAEFYLFDPTTGTRKPNLELLRDHFFHEGRLSHEQATWILEEAIALMSQEPNLVRVSGPATVVGDIHGQYYDLMKVFDVGGKFEDSNYVFLGDYVDRGCFSIECLLYVYAIKLCYPTRVTLLRGNHECRHLTGFFTFKQECLRKYDEKLYDTCIRSFQALPVTALIDNKFFCVHGGISPELAYLSDLNHLNRFQEPGSTGLLCDLLWADPLSTYGHESDVSGHNPNGVMPPPFLQNEVRGCSYFFTYQAVADFLARNKLLGIFRGHEAQDHGYMMYRKTPGKQFPSLITVFSAPNYIDVYHNKGAIIKYKDKTITIRQFNSSSHPYWLPNFMDAFTWSLPFVASKILEMLLGVLSVCTEEELESPDAEMPSPEADAAERRQEIRNKIMAVGKISRLYNILREETERTTELMADVGEGFPGSWPGGPTSAPPDDSLGAHSLGLRKSIRSFDQARHADIANERLPQLPSAAEAQEPPLGAPSMWRDKDRLTNQIRRVLEEDFDPDTVDKIAEKLAASRLGDGVPPARGQLKRFETT